MESFSDFDSCPNYSFSLHVDMSLFQQQSIQMWWMFVIHGREAEKLKNRDGGRKITLNDIILKIISLSMLLRNGYDDSAYDKKQLTVNSILYKTGNLRRCSQSLMKNFNSVGASGIVCDSGLFSSEKIQKKIRCAFSVCHNMEKVGWNKRVMAQRGIQR